jgi:hypothetical protein
VSVGESSNPSQDDLSRTRLAAPKRFQGCSVLLHRSLSALKMALLAGRSPSRRTHHSLMASAIPFGAVCPYPQPLRHLRVKSRKHRNRVRVNVRSCVDGHILRVCSESEARQMCGENSDGSKMLGQDGKAVEPIAYRMTRLKAPLTDIKLLARERQPRNVKATLTFADVQNNAFAKAFKELGGPEISIRALESAENKVAAWPEIHDDRAVVICAGKVYRPEAPCAL